MSYDVFFSGVGGVVLGGLLTVKLTHHFQKQLLDQQLAFLKAQNEEDAKLRKLIYDEWAVVFVEFRNMLNTKLGRIT